MTTGRFCGISFVKSVPFCPGRFLPARRNTIDRFSYLPFGGGMHAYIGASFAMKALPIVLATLVRRFRFELDPRHTVRPMVRLTLGPEGGLPIRLHHR